MSVTQIQIGGDKPAPQPDPLGRGRIGYFPGISEAEAWERGRAVWKLNPQVVLTKDELQVVNTSGLVLAVGEITGITKAGDRYIIEGNLLQGDARVGQQTTTPHPSQNPVYYP